MRVYAQPGEPERFRAALTSVLDQAWHPEKLVARAHALAALVRANGLTSPREETTMATFEAALADRIAFINERAAAVRAQLAAAPS